MRRILLTGDVQLTGISCMLGRLPAGGSDLRGDALKFPHHGAWPTGYHGIREFPGMKKRELSEFLAAVDPEVVVLSVGFDNRDHHVHPGVFKALRELRSTGRRLKRIVCTQLTRLCHGTGCSPLRTACAGDILLLVGDGVPDKMQVLPAPSDHASAILEAIPPDHAQCAGLQGY
jgi:hypothetical protein